MGEKFTTNPVTGSCSLTVPIPTSPGRSDFGPELTLSYDSGAGNGPFGFGWSLSLPCITRKTDKGLPRYGDYFESDVFVLSGAEDLVPLLDSNEVRHEDSTSHPGFTIHRYRPRIEGLFARIERWTNDSTGEKHWRSITRDNITTLYGKDNSSRIFDPTRPTRVFCWLISESYDDKGNAIVYEYAGENDAGTDRSLPSERNRIRTANRYLKRVKYGNEVSLLVAPDISNAKWLFELVFDYDEGHYEELPLDSAQSADAQHSRVRVSPDPGSAWKTRLDPFSSYRSAFEIRTYRRCRRVFMFHRFPELNQGRWDELGDEPYLVRSLALEYNDFDNPNSDSIDEELAHQGSTRFASFLQSITQSGYVRDDSQPLMQHSGAKYITYLKKSLPPLAFEYTKAKIQSEVRQLDPTTLLNMPVGVDGSTYQWIDLDGEGIPGVLTKQAGAWHYKRNRGDGRFDMTQTLRTQPSMFAKTASGEHLVDLGGDGRLSVVSFTGRTPGYYERTPDGNWSKFRSLLSAPKNIPYNDPNLRFVDLTGDGCADILITENGILSWYQSLGREGFSSRERIATGNNEEKGPCVLFADGTQSIHV
jgi:hypothetical protein